MVFLMSSGISIFPLNVAPCDLNSEHESCFGSAVEQPGNIAEIRQVSPELIKLLRDWQVMY